jgi:hypothetical protein
MAKLVEELDSTLGPPSSKNSKRQTHSIANLEDSLPYLMACVNENFRMTPVFTMQLWRRVTRSEGLAIGNVVLPQNVRISLEPRVTVLLTPSAICRQTWQPAITCSTTTLLSGVSIMPRMIQSDGSMVARLDFTAP